MFISKDDKEDIFQRLAKVESLVIDLGIRLQRCEKKPIVEKPPAILQKPKLAELQEKHAEITAEIRKLRQKEYSRKHYERRKAQK